MSESIRKLTDLALKAAELPTLTSQAFQSPFSSGDPIIDHLMGLVYTGISQEPTFIAARDELKKDPALKELLPVAGKLDPMIFSALGGGSRHDFDSTITELLSSAAKQLYMQGIPVTESAFVQEVLQNYEELKRALRGEQVRAYTFRGLSGISVDAGVKITTPWGVIRAIEEVAPPTPMVFGSPKLKTTAVLLTQQLTQTTISRESSPDVPEPDQKLFSEMQRAQTLTSLVFALASVDKEPGAPLITFQTTTLPFMGGGGYSTAIAPANPFVPLLKITKNDVKRIEDLAKMLYDKHHDSLQIASQRIVSAISQRLDKSDALIDAVTAWESLVGTRNETVYRVTASLTNLLEPDRAKRSTFRKELGNIYDLRSRVVHGDTVDAQEVIETSAQAIKIALRAMLALYKLEGDWLAMKSRNRSERLILGF